MSNRQKKKKYLYIDTHTQYVGEIPKLLQKKAQQKIKKCILFNFQYNPLL